MFLRGSYQFILLTFIKILSYVKDDRTIILCVIPANADISTSDGL